MTARFGINARNNKSVSLGDVSTQPRAATITTSDDRNRFSSGGTAVANIFGGTINPGNVSGFLPGKPFLQTNSLIQIAKSLVAVKKTKTYDPDNLSTSTTRIVNGNFEPVEKNGISSFRPEILSIIDFLPTYTGGPVKFEQNKFSFSTSTTTPAGDFIEIQYQASLLRQETLVRMMQNIEKAYQPKNTNIIKNSNLLKNLDIRKILFFPKLSNLNVTTKINKSAIQNLQKNKEQKIKEIQNKINSIRTEYDQTIKELDSTISFFSNALDTIQLLKKSLNIKEIPSNLYNKDFLSLDRFFEKKMQYDLKKFKSFSDTKILLQLLFDFRSILETYSFSLLDLTDEDRINDNNPVKIDRTYTQSKNFTFNISNLRSSNKVVNATEINFFNSFVNSLPENADDRIKILITLLSKEYRVSKALGQENIKRSLEANFNSKAEGNPFDNIIGDIGATIFQKPEGINSLSSLMFVTNINNDFILPFESKYIDSNEEKITYTPGSNYFVDTIIDFNTANPVFNTRPYFDYVLRYNNILTKARGIIEDIFDFDNPTSTLISTKVNDIVLNSIKSNLTTLVDINAFKRSDLNQAIIASVFKLSNKDSQLKNLLFQFIALAGITVNKLYTQTQKKEIFKLLADELVNTSAFSAAGAAGINKKLNDNDIAGYLAIVLDSIAKKIEDRVFLLTNKISFNVAKNINFSDTSGIRRPALRSLTNDGLNTAVSRRALTANSFDVSTTLVSSVNNFTKIKIQKGQINKALINDTLNPSTGTTNFIQEFIKIADSIQSAAVTQGTNAYLLSDGTNRTRFNYLSTSTQLLMIFEIFSNYVGKYVYANFEISNSLIQTSINIDNFGNKNTLYTINELLAMPVVPITKNDITNQIQKANYIDISTKKNLNLDFLQQGKTTTYKSGLDTKFNSITTIANSNSSQRNTSKTAYSANIYNQVNRQVADAFNTSSAFNSLISTNYQEAASVSNLFSNAIENNLNLNLALSFKTQYFVSRVNLFSIRNKISDEEKTIANILHILFIIGSWLKQGTNYANNFFNQTTLLQFLKTNSISSLDILSNPSQVRNSAYILDLIKEKIPDETYSPDTGKIYNNIIISDVVRKEENLTLNSFLIQNDFTLRNKADKKIKLFTIGIPSGFSKKLSDRVDIRNINQKTFKDKQFDVISINVYKRDAKNEDLVFKPQKFLFDLSLYQREKDIVRIQPKKYEFFNNLISRAVVTDYENIKIKNQIGYNDILSNPKYSFLSNLEKRQLIYNHLSSYLLATYINFLTGIRFYEDEFLQNPYKQGNQINSTLLSLVYDYIINVLNIQIPQNLSIEEMLKLPNLNSDAKDVLTLISYGSFAFEPEYIKSCVLQPKLFDRIFTVPVDITKFEIDENLTISTDSGRLAYRSSNIQEKIIKTNNKIYLKENTDGLIFEDYFITIEAGY